MIEKALDAVARWPVPAAGVAVLQAGELTDLAGDVDVPSRIASVSKLITAYSIAIAVSEGAVELSDEVGPPGSTLAHLLAHTSGYGFESTAPVMAPAGTRRIYSNRGIETAAAQVAAESGIPFAEYVREAVLEPLGMRATDPVGSPAFGFHSTVRDLALFAAELNAPKLLDPGILADWTAVHFSGLNGVIPGVGRFDPCDWGLGFERNFSRPGHWAGTAPSSATFGHFGGTGSFCWVDPVHHVAAVCLTGREFSDWAMEVWPPLCDAIVADRSVP